VNRAVEVIDQTAGRFPSKPAAELVAAVLDAERVEGSVVVAFVEESAIKDLNARYREAAESTDVLSFRYADEHADWPEPGLEDEAELEGAEEQELGEIVVCPSVVRGYADEEGRAPSWQLGWTLIHGTLHLIGYDHERDEGQMRAREQALLDELVSLMPTGLFPDEAEGSFEG
jgi:probable rRNA maturation factor